MKRIINKTTTAIILALAMAFALVGSLLFVRKANVANAASPATVTSTIDKTAYFPGDKIQYKLTIGTSDAGVYHSVTLRIAILTNATTVNAAASSNFTFSNFETTAVTWTNLPGDADYDADFDDSSSYVGGIYTFSLSKDSMSAGLSASQPIELTFDVDIKSTTPLGDYKIGVLSAQACFVRTQNGSAQVTHATDNATLTTNTIADFTVKEASNNNNLDTLKIGQGDNESDLTDTTVADTMSITVTDPSLPLSVLPTTEDAGAKVVLQPGNVEVEKDKIGKVEIPANGEVKIEVTAENGEKKTYTINVTVNGAALSNLVITNDTAKTGLTKNGFDTAKPFASATEEYTIYVPNDSTTLTITATVTNSNGASNIMDIEHTGTWSAPSTATSGTAFQATGIKDVIADNNTLTIKCKNTAGQVTKTYVLTFDVVDVDTSIKTLTIVGATNNSTQFTNDAELATANSKDYYFFVVGEPNGQSKVTIEANSANVLSVKWDSAAYTAPVNNVAAGDHTITIQAEAGNSQTYTLTLKNKLSLKLKADAAIDFVHKKSVETGDLVYDYVETYKKANMVHGVDDLKAERIIIGKIAEGTSINAFLANFQADQLGNIRLYKHHGEKMVELGQPASGHTAAELDDNASNAVGTGWYIEYVVNGTVEETIYVSVLGDVDGDGYITPYDISLVTVYVAQTDLTTLAKLEYYLAAMITNYGTISSGDIGEMGNYYMGDHNVYDTVFAAM